MALDASGSALVQKLSDRDATICAMPGYAVLDLETTGLSAAKGDRIVEIGIVQLSPLGVVEGEWTTLVNPQSKVTATRIHHLTDADVAPAPTLGQLSGQLIAQLSGRAIVAHNAAFDVPFLEQELRRVGVPLTNQAIPRICTMLLARRYLDVPRRSLDVCCKVAGISQQNAHSALGDARAAAQLFEVYRLATKPPEPWAKVLVDAAKYPWPQPLVAHPVTLVPRSQ